jgi:hypothetical protein
MLRLSLDDPALINALMFTLAFAVNGFTADAECLKYKGKAIFYLNRRFSAPRLQQLSQQFVLSFFLLVLRYTSLLLVHSHSS